MPLLRLSHLPNHPMSTSSYALLVLGTCVMLAQPAQAQKLGSSVHFLHNADQVPVGELEAVGQLGERCTATLVTQEIVLTAAHCVCNDNGSCIARDAFSFRDVFPVDDPNTPVDESTVRRDVTISGNVFAHPRYNMGGWLINDYAIIRLDEPANERVLNVRPIPVERPDEKPAVGDQVTLVGFGRTGDGCNDEPVGKRKTDVQVSEVSDVTIVFQNTNTYVCRGDSGGPALNAAGNVIGVASTGNSASNSNYDPTYVAYPWIFDTERVQRTTGRISMLRVHEVGTGYGSSTDPIEGEVIIQLDTHGKNGFGFPLRLDGGQMTHKGMLDLFRDAFSNDWSVQIEYQKTGPSNATILRAKRVQ